MTGTDPERPAHEVPHCKKFPIRNDMRLQALQGIQDGFQPTPIRQINKLLEFS